MGIRYLPLTNFFSSPAQFVKEKKKIPNSELEVFEILWKNFFKQRKIYYLKEPIKYLSQVNKKKLFKEKENDFIQKISNFQKKTNIRSNKKIMENKIAILINWPREIDMYYRLIKAIPSKKLKLLLMI